MAAINVSTRKYWLHFPRTDDMLNINLNNLTSGIARHLIIYVVLFSFFITLLATFFQLYRDYSNDINLIEAQLQQTQDVHLKSLTATLWASDSKELKTHLEGISQLRDMQFLQIQDQEKIWVTVGSKQTENAMSREYPMIYSHRGRDIEIGTLTVVASLTGVYQRLVDKIWVILISNGIKIFLVAGFILFIFHTLITRHLIHIADYVHTFDINSPDGQLRLDRQGQRKGKTDELDLAVNAINQMQTNIKESFNALEQKEGLFQVLARVSPVGIFRTDAQGSCIYTNERWRELAGMSESEALGEGWALALHPEDREQVFKDWYQAAAEKIPFKTECRFLRSDGEVSWLLTLAEAEVNAEDQVVGYVGTITDITERKQAETELNKYRHQLEELVGERTKELRDTQDELVRKERLATLGQLTATVSHELRNPLGAMRPSLYIINKQSDQNDNRVQRAIALVDRNIERCDHIIDELLDYTRITELDLHSTPLDKWIASVIDEQDIPAAIGLETDFSLNDMKLAIDPNRLRRAIINVVENACHAMLDEKNPEEIRPNAHLTIKTRENKNRIEISISDTGTGIPKPVLSKIFVPLFSTKGFGVGLGMPTVKQIMEQHGGDIEIDTKEGKGSSVTLWLPNGAADLDSDNLVAHTN